MIQGSKNDKNREIESAAVESDSKNRCVQSYNRSSVYIPVGFLPVARFASQERRRRRRMRDGDKSYGLSSLCEPRAAPSAPYTTAGRVRAGPYRTAGVQMKKIPS